MRPCHAGASGAHGGERLLIAAIYGVSCSSWRQRSFICRHQGVSWEAISSATVGIAAQPDAGLGCCAAGPPRGGVDVALAAEVRAAFLPAEAGLGRLLRPVPTLSFFFWARTGPSKTRVTIATASNCQVCKGISLWPWRTQRLSLS